MSLRILAMTSLFPNPYQPNKWAPNHQQLHLLAKLTPVSLLVPIPWTTEKKGKRREGDLLRSGRIVQDASLNIEYGKYWFPPGMLRGKYGAFYHWSVRRLFRRKLESFEPDLIFTHWAYPDGWAAVKLGHAAGLPVVLQVLGSDVLLLDQHPARRAGTLAALREADGIWAVSQDLAHRLVDLQVDPRRVRVIYDGIDPDIFHPGNQMLARQKLGLGKEERIILFVGNLMPVKRINRLISACVSLRGQMPGLHCYILGQGELQSALERQIAQLQAGPFITLMGSRPLAELCDWYRAADVLALTSDSEGVPNVLLEAKACGLPYVASRVGGVSEIDYVGAHLVPPGDQQTLQDALRTALAGPRPVVTPVKTRLLCMEEALHFFQCVHSRYHDPQSMMDTRVSRKS